jgi:hypothetical protein
MRWNWSIVVRKITISNASYYVFTRWGVPAQYQFIYYTLIYVTRDKCDPDKQTDYDIEYRFY